ncbi:MAG TPA: glycosyltransferase, partial [Chthoniobacterales bacterium]
MLIVNYNYEQYLAAAIESVLAQTYQNFEIVICDDGSKDDSRAVITRYAAEEPRIRPIFKQNGGMGAALNDAFAASTGAIIAMLDADDLFLPHKLDAVIAALRGGGRVGIVFHPLTMVDVNGEAIGRMPQFGNFEQGELREGILRAGGHVAGAPNSAIAMRRECALRAFPIPAADFRSEADAYLRVAGALFYAVAALDEPLSAYRVHSSNLTAS